MLSSSFNTYDSQTIIFVFPPATSLIRISLTSLALGARLVKITGLKHVLVQYNLSLFCIEWCLCSITRYIFLSASVFSILHIFFCFLNEKLILDVGTYFKVSMISSGNFPIVSMRGFTCVRSPQACKHGQCGHDIIMVKFGNGSQPRKL